MANEKIQIGITAQDDASKALEEVAKKAQKLEDLKKIQLEIEAEIGKAESDLESLEETAEALEKLDPEIEATADTSSAEGDLENVEGDAEELDGRKVEIDVRADTSGAEAGLRRVGQAGREGGAGIDIAGNSAADLAGPLGAAEGAASTAAGVFDGLTDIVTGLGPAMGLSASAATGLGTALAAAGFVVAAGAALWSKLKENQDKAAESARELADAQLELADALKEGDVEDAVEKLDELAKTEADKTLHELAEAAEAAGTPLDELANFIAGNTDSMPLLEAAIASADAAWKSLQENTSVPVPKPEDLQAMEGLRDDALEVRDAYSGVAGSGADAARETEVFGDALGNAVGPAEGLKTAVENVEIAERHLADFRRGLADSTFAQEGLLRDLQEAHEDTAASAVEAWTTVDDKTTPFVNEAQEAMQNYLDTQHDEVGAAAAFADGAARVAEDAARARGVTDTAATGQKAWNDAMIAQAITAKGPLRQGIIDYIATANGIPPEKVTEILANANPDDLAAVAEAIRIVSLGLDGQGHPAPINPFVPEPPKAETEGDLSDLARDRPAHMNAEAKTAAAEHDLRFAARRRDAELKAEAKTVAAEGALNNLARSRTVPIKVAFTPDLSNMTRTQQAAFNAGRTQEPGQYGLDRTVTEPTSFLAGEHGFPERVQITPMGAHGLAAASGGGGAGVTQSFNYNINLPKGTRGDDLIRTMRQHARRNGGKVAF
jgi:hypothetical protein